jgi:hypothetical protein
MKRRILSLSLALVFLFITAPGATANDTPGFVISQGILWRYTGSAAVVNIPDGVQTIAGEFLWLQNSVGQPLANQTGAPKTRVTRVNLNSGVRWIGAGAFRDSRMLTTVDMPRGLAVIEFNAFEDCPLLDDVVLPWSVTEIGAQAFKNCPSLKSITIPPSVIHFQFLGWASVPANNRYDDPEQDIFQGCHPDLTIYGVAGSAAEKYAKDKGIKFKAIDYDAFYNPVGIPRSMNNFQTDRTYDGRFTDLNWSRDWVRKAYEYGIIAGTSPTTYGSAQNMSIQNALVIASKIHAIYNTGSENAVTDGAVWPTSFISYALEHNIIDSRFEGRYAQDATRAEIVYMWSGLVPLPAINTYDPFPDVRVTHEHYGAIRRFYEAGIITGSTGGNFRPNDPIDRGECAVMFVRIVNPADRKRVG